MSVLTIRRLDPRIDGRSRRARFRCGNRALDRWFQTRAVANQETYGVTYLAVTATEEIAGFIAVASSAAQRSAFETEQGPQVWPALLVARMGIAEHLHGQGVGQMLVLHAFDLALQQASQTGCAVVLVDAKPESVDYYRNQFGFQPLARTEPSNTTPMYVLVEALRAARDGDM